MPEHRLKGVYGKPLQKRVGKTIPLTKDQLARAAQIILDAIKKEIKRDIARSSGMRPAGAPVPLPQTTRFADSFKFRLKGKSTIEITSNWPTAEAHTTPSDEIDPANDRPKPSSPIPMTWLTRDKVPFARIVQSDGKVVVRTTPDPSKGDDLWIHPGFRKYTFLERGIRKGRDQAVEALAAELIQGLLDEYDLFG